jgi:lipoprotein NlpD
MKTLASWNGIKPPYVIQLGQRLHLRPSPGYRKPAIKTPVKVIPPIAERPALGKGNPQSSVSENKQVAKATPPEDVFPRNNLLKWQWPTDGKLVAKFLPTGLGKSGINIQGKTGQAVVAAASGKVVYSGNGLKGYGELIIIKHSEDLLSAYAYNRRRLVNEGSWAKKGQRIAELGSGGKGPPLLHFEIRKKGKPVDPLKFLPKQP